MNNTMLTILSLLPILSLLLCLIVLKLSVAKAGAISLALALVIALFAFGMNALGLSVAVGKALSVALFVSLIVWGALLLYHLVSDFKAIDVITKNITIFVEDKFVAFVLLAWLFTGLLQGMAGFGVPAVIVAPILIALGFNPVKSLAAALLGHSWAVTFGSMGAAFFVISNITGNPPEALGIPMWIFNTIAHVGTGFGVCWLYDGFKGVKKGLAYILPVSIIMAVVQYFTIFFGLYALGTINPALAGLATMFILYKLRARAETKPRLYAGDLTLVQALLPYATILAVSILFSFLPADLRNNIAVSFRFPETITALGYSVPAETNYMAIRLFGHPSVILILASVVAILIYKRAKVWDSGVFRGAVKKTVKKGIPATIALLFLGSMSLIMKDSGMTHHLAYQVADVTGRFYPLSAPFLGVLASFLTGNNTNSNVLFGYFQHTIAGRLDVSSAVMSAVQSISGAVGVSIGPTLVLMGATATKLTGQESQIIKKLIGIVLLIALVMGIANFILLNVMHYGA
ncbi:MAG: L-lactate permease [Oscillospiraceae bacterium]|nr:L-lactate permease [Oscillospiraceae bacterium]